MIFVSSSFAIQSSVLGGLCLFVCVYFLFLSFYLGVFVSFVCWTVCILDARQLVSVSHFKLRIYIWINNYDDIKSQHNCSRLLKKMCDAVSVIGVLFFLIYLIVVVSFSLVESMNTLNSKLQNCHQNRTISYEWTNKDLPCIHVLHRECCNMEPL